MRRIAATCIAPLAFVFMSPASAQNVLQYRCEDGAQLAVAFVEKSNSAYVQIDGKSLALPQRISGSGARYSKSGVTFWIKGDDAQLKRPKSKWTRCKTG